MKVEKVRIRQLSGTMETEGPLWEERQLRPLDIYDDLRPDPAFEGGEQIDNKSFRLTQWFLQIDTDEGVSGIAGPLWRDSARLILSQLAPRLLGQDPLATEYLWDRMHRAQVHGRQGDAMLALSAVDCALWDLKGRWLDQPVWRLLGGATREAVPAYASMLGFSVDDLDLVCERARTYRDLGFRAQKWFFRHGPMSGAEGLKRNVALVHELRTALGDGYDLMFDCWQGFSYEYAADLAVRIEEYRPRWLEEPFLPDRIGTYARLKAKTSIPLAGAEHEYTRWGVKRFIERQALDILQPDIYWCGGLSETLKIAALATTHDLTFIPHGTSTPAGIHFSAAQSPVHTPMIEYLVKWNQINMHFLKNPPWPEAGDIHLSSVPGLGMDIDQDRIEEENYLEA